MKKNISGVYAIINLVNYKFYIGSSIQLSDREWEHFYDLRRGKHGNEHLQRSYNKHGKDKFRFIVLETAKSEECLIREQYYLDTLLYAQEYIKEDDKRFCRFGYNINPLAGRSNACSIPVYQYSLEGKFIKRWYNSIEAAKTLKTKSTASAAGGIRMVCSGRKPYAYNYFWSDKFILDLLPIPRIKRICTDSHRANMSKCRINIPTPNRRRPILQFSPDKELIREWGGAIEAATYLTPDNPTKGMKLISQACARNKFYITLGSRWRYKT